MILLLILLTSSCYAGEIEGVAYTSVEVNGVAYQVPLANNEYKQKIYFLKRALHGDREALDMILEGSDENMIYIGDKSPRWVSFDKEGNFEFLPQDGNLQNSEASPATMALSSSEQKGVSQT